MIMYDSLCIFLQVAANMNFGPSLSMDGMSLSEPTIFEPRASMYAKQPSPPRNKSNTVRNESLKEDICFGYLF